MLLDELELLELEELLELLERPIELDELDELEYLIEELRARYVTAQEAARRLDGQVLDDESDYIVEGNIDPDNVSSTSMYFGPGQQEKGWNCVEGWNAYRHGDDLYIQWYRNAYGGDRRSRSLWVCVDKGFFAEVEEDV